MKRACPDSVSYVLDPEGDIVLATVDDSERSQAENEKLYRWQAIPHSMLKNGKEIFLVYLGREIVSLDEILQCQPFTGLVSRKCDCILINDGVEVHALRDTGIKPNSFATLGASRFWLNEYNEYASFPIEFLQSMKDMSVVKLMESGLGKVLKTHHQSECIGGQRISLRPFKSLKMGAIAIYDYIGTQGIHYFCSITRMEFNKERSEILRLYHYISHILVLNELPPEIIFYFLSHQRLWQLIPSPSKRDLEPRGNSRFSSMTFH